MNCCAIFKVSGNLSPFLARLNTAKKRSMCSGAAPGVRRVLYEHHVLTGHFCSLHVLLVGRYMVPGSLIAKARHIWTFCGHLRVPHISEQTGRYCRKRRQMCFLVVDGMMALSPVYSYTISFVSAFLC